MSARWKMGTKRDTTSDAVEVEVRRLMRLQPARSEWVVVVVVVVVVRDRRWTEIM